MLDLPSYNAAAWHWRIAGETRCWSSAIGSFVDTVADTVPVTSLETLAELDEVLRRNGLKSPLVTAADIDAEKARRIEQGRVFAVDGLGPVHVTGRPQDQTTLLALQATATGMNAAGVTGALLPLHDGADTDHLMTPQQMLALARVAFAYATAVDRASWALKAMEPLPAAIDADALWPALE